MNLSNPVGATISDAQGVATILDDDGEVAANNLFIADIRFDSKRTLACAIGVRRS